MTKIQIAVFNPNGKALEELPVIYGFNNGGSAGWLSAELLAEDGTPLGGHICSHEAYMPHDLGIFDGARPDRHETFRKHYPDGYRMEFVGYADIPEHKKLHEAFELNRKLSAVPPAAPVTDEISEVVAARKD